MEERTQKYHYLLAAVLGVAGLLIILIFVSLRSQTSSVDTTVAVTNAAPTLSTINVGSADGGSQYNDSYTPTAETTSTIYVSGVITDTNGCNDITTAGGDMFTVAFYTNTVGDVACNTIGENEDTQCFYKVKTSDGCSLGSTDECSSAEDETVSFVCSFALPHYIDPDAWTSKVWVTDQNSGTVSSTQGLTVTTLTAFNYTADIDYGTVAIRATSTEQTVNIINTGNDNDLDLQITLQAMDCSGSQKDIEYTNQFFSLSSTGIVTSSMTKGDGSAQASALNLTKGTASASTPTLPVYFGLEVPAGAAGTCTGSTTITAN
ncbi:MAG: hypothetical protein ABH832_02810 [bacterium]